MVDWATHDASEIEYLHDPEELLVRFYIAVDQFFYISAETVIDYYALDFQTAKDVKAVHPDIFTDPSSGEQYRPISELNLIRSRYNP